MRVWQVDAVGEGFMKDGVRQDCQLSGLVRANDSNDAFSKVCSIAMQDHAELRQATGPFPRPVINPEEIQEVYEVPLIHVNQVEVFWIER